uniref:Fatty acyl-CoA reductase n=1 Tax=Euglena gracilis TaxID=3039 RepID=D7PN08_EUGGR|nr:fatty acyl-coenzyme A reductase [Euglena gracilis]
MNDFYAGKGVFLTGVTGFVGKMVVEKILRSLPTVGRLYVLVRPKAGTDPHQRLHSEVWSSAGFDVVREKVGGPAAFDALIREKVVPVPGDMVKDRFGLDDAAYRSLAANVNVIIHMAATIDFTERLDVAVSLNVLGTVRVLTLARRARELGALHSVVHVSTCYVNSNQPPGARLREQLYPLPFDPREMCTRILDMSPREIDLFGPQLLKQYGFPNTYTFTKCMAEQLGAQIAHDLPFAIFRPAIIGAALSEPFPGWCDSASACGAVFLAVGLGVLQELQGNASSVCDLIPVDHVVNMLLVTAAYTASAPPADPSPSSLALSPPQLPLATLPPGTVADVPIYHCGTSAGPNAVNWGRIKVSLVEYWNAHPIAKTKAAIALLPVWRFELSFLLKRRLPATALSLVASLPGASAAVRRQAEQTERLVGKMRKLVDTFQSFVFWAWYFQTESSARLLASLCPEDRETFNWDPRRIGWRAWVENYCYGLVRYVLKQPIGDRPPVAAEELASNRFLRAML